MEFKEEQDKISSFNSIYGKIEKQFPISERKPENSLKKILTNKRYKVFNILENSSECGYFTFFEFMDNTILIDYFAIYPQYHSNGFGTKAFELMKKTFSYKGCFLEVEKINHKEPNTIRRINFYTKLGAIKLDINYLYPNSEGYLPMDLYFMPFKNKYCPERTNVMKNIEEAFKNIHFDIKNTQEILSLIKHPID